MTPTGDGEAAPGKSESLDDGYIDARARHEFIRMGFAGFLISFMYSHNALLAVIFERKGHDLQAIGLLLSLYSIPVLAASLFSGTAAARFGVLQTCRLAAVLMIVGMLALRFTVADFWPALAARFVQGIGQGLFLGATITYGQSRLSTKRFVYLLSVFSSMLPLAQAFAPPIGAYVLNHYGASAVFDEAIVPAVLGIALTFGLRPVPRSLKPQGLAFTAGLRRDRITPLVAVFVNGTLFGFTTAYLAATLEARALPIAAFFIASTAAMFAARLLAMRRFEATNRQLLIAAGFLVQAVSFILIAIAGHFWLVVVAGFLFGIGYSVVYPVLSAWMSEGVEPAERAGPQGLLNTIFNIGSFVMPYPETLVIAAYGYGGVLAALALLGTAFAAYLIWLTVRAR